MDEQTENMEEALLDMGHWDFDSNDIIC